MATPSPNPHVLDVTIANFEKEVLQRSLSTPVLVDFWASWCEPCKTLGPALEKVALEMGGALLLAKVDIDANPELADAFGVQNVPTVVLVKAGQVVDGFVGAQPEPKIRELLTRQGIAPAKTVDVVAQALELEKQGQLEEAVRQLRSHVVMGGGDARARAQLARLCALAGRTDEARKTWDALPESEKESDAGRAAKAMLDLVAGAGDLAQLEAQVQAAPDDLAARLALGRGLLAARQFERAFEQLWFAAQRDLAFNASEPRAALVEAFGLLGEDHALTKQYRRKLSVLLCS